MRSSESLQGSQAFERNRLNSPTKVKSTTSRKGRTLMLIKNTREKIRRNSRRRVLKLASASGLSYETMQTLIKF